MKKKNKHVDPFKGHEDIPIDIASSKLAINGSDLAPAAHALNVAILPPRVLKELDSIGVRLDESGVIQTGNKWLCVTGEALIKCTMLIAGDMKTAKDAERVAPALSSLAKAIAMVAGNMSDTVVERGGQTPVGHKAKAFPAGAAVQSLTQINIGVPQKPA